MKAILKLLLLTVACAASTGQAAMLTLNPTDSGLYDRILLFSPGSLSYQNTQDPLTVMSNDYGHTSAGLVMSAAYLIFDLQALPIAADTATLRFNFGTDFDDEGPLNTYSLDTISNAALAALSPGQTLGSPGQVIWDDLTTGPTLAPTQVGKAGELNIALNPLALAQINGADGLWGLGLKLNLPLISAPIAGLRLLDTPELRLTGSLKPVPVPATLWLTALSLLALALFRSRAVPTCNFFGGQTTFSMSPIFSAGVAIGHPDVRFNSPIR